MKDNLIINGIEYTPVQKTKDPEPKYLWMMERNGFRTTFLEEVPECIRYAPCPVGSVVISPEKLATAWDKHCAWAKDLRTTTDPNSVTFWMFCEDLRVHHYKK